MFVILNEMKDLIRFFTARGGFRMTIEYKEDRMKKVIAVAKNIGSKLSGALVLSRVFGATAYAQDFDATNVRAIPILQGINLMKVISNIINIVLIVAGILAVAYLIYGGLMYITAGGEAEKATKGRTAITNAIIGIIIIAASLAIYNYVIDTGLEGGI